MLIKKKVYFCNSINNLKHNKMKANLVKLNKLKEVLEEKLESMEWAMEERSEKWHESEACEIHEDKMNALDTAIMNIDDAIQELADAFDLQDLF